MSPVEVRVVSLDPLLLYTIQQNPTGSTPHLTLRYLLHKLLPIIYRSWCCCLVPCRCCRRCCCCCCFGMQPTSPAADLPKAIICHLQCSHKDNASVGSPGQCCQGCTTAKKHQCSNHASTQEECLLYTQLLELC